MEFRNRGIARIHLIIVVVVVIAIAAVAGYLTMGTEEDETVGTTAEQGWVPDPQVDLDEETPHIGLITMGLGNPYSRMNRQGIEWYIEDVVGWEVTTVSGEASVETQNTGAEDLIREDVDAIILGATSEEGNAKIGEICREHNIPLLTYNSDIDHYAPIGYFQRRDYESGQLAAEYTAEHMMDLPPEDEVAGKVLVARGLQGSTVERMRTAGFADHMEQYDNIEISYVGNSWSASEEQSKQQSWLNSNPDVKAVYQEYGGFSSSIMTAMKNLDWSEEEAQDIIITNVDCFPETLQAFEEGYMDMATTTPQGPYYAAPMVGTLRRFWNEGPEALPKIGENFTKSDTPELIVDQTVGPNNIKPMQWYADEEPTIVPCPIIESPTVGENTPFINLNNRIVDKTNYTENWVPHGWEVWH